MANSPWVVEVYDNCSHFQIICVVLSIVSILPKVQEHLPKSGLLQSSCITLYIMYLTVSPSEGPYFKVVK